MRKWRYLSSWPTNHKTKGTFPSQTLKVEEKKVALLFWFLAQETRYGHFIFWSSGSEVRTIVRGRNCQYLGPWAINDKNKDTLLSQTLKVEEKKVHLFFLFEAQEPRYGHFIYWSSGSEVRTIVKGRNCQYLGSWATNHKTNNTLLSQTLKVEEKKVSLIFWFVAQEPRYGHCVFWTTGGGVRAIVMGKKPSILAPWAIN